MNQLNLLLLDDDEALLFNLKLFLEDENIAVTPAVNAEEALQHVKNNKFDIAIVDIKLPGMNGNDFMKYASRIDRKLKYIVHTGSDYYSIPDELKRLNLPIHDVLIKPIDNMEKFTQKIYESVESNSVDL
ncbi:MAG: response regulator [Ignavibacteriaceae bacterium]|nr:response regulator [Ignavibacteriaceae bacterium]